jgi:CRISPR/Cas system-associated protein endoribonuclease Cas2
MTILRSYVSFHQLRTYHRIDYGLLSATSGREQVQQNAPQNGHLNLLNDLVGTRKYRRRYLKTQHLGRLEIDGKF